MGNQLTSSDDDLDEENKENEDETAGKKRKRTKEKVGRNEIEANRNTKAPSGTPAISGVKGK